MVPGSCGRAWPMVGQRLKARRVSDLERHRRRRLPVQTLRFVCGADKHCLPDRIVPEVLGRGRSIEHTVSLRGCDVAHDAVDVCLEHRAQIRAANSRPRVPRRLSRDRPPRGADRCAHRWPGAARGGAETPRSRVRPRGPIRLPARRAGHAPSIHSVSLRQRTDCPHDAPQGS